MSLPRALIADGGGSDWFGATVNLAARVSGAAAGDEVLLTETTRAAAGELDDAEFIEHGRHGFRNVAEPVLLFRAIALGTDQQTSDLPIDPVCRMAIDPARAAGQILYEQHEYHFCSIACIRRFAEGPERFISEPNS